MRLLSSCCLLRCLAIHQQIYHKEGSEGRLDHLSLPRDSWFVRWVYLEEYVSNKDRLDDTDNSASDDHRLWKALVESRIWPTASKPPLL